MLKTELETKVTELEAEVRRLKEWKRQATDNCGIGSCSCGEPMPLGYAHGACEYGTDYGKEG